LAYCEPAAHAGGGGAVWVLLKSAANKKTHQNEKGG
jgi:DNA-nicking Smr family endonuclease